MEYDRPKYECSLHCFDKRYREHKFFGQVNAKTLKEIKIKARKQAINNINKSGRITITDLNTGKQFRINP